MTSHYSNEKYHLLNTKISEDFFQGKYPVRVYQNASLALYDVTMGSQQYLSHKNHLGLVKNGSSLIEALSPFWLRQGVPLQYKSESQTWVEYIETLSSETNFVVWSSENEITGEILVSDQDAVDIHERLSKKRIFSIQVTHRLNPSINLSPYAILVIRKSIFADDSAMVVMTDKMKAISLIGAFQNTDLITLSDFKNTDDPDCVKIVEDSLQSSRALYFHQFAMVPARMQDRIVIAFKDINAYALQQELALSQADSFSPARYPFWVLDSWKNWWKECDPSTPNGEALLRGLIIIKTQAFRADPLLTQKIEQAVMKIRRLGQWNALP